MNETFLDGLQAYAAVIRSVIGIGSITMLIVTQMWWAAILIAAFCVPLFISCVTVRKVLGHSSNNAVKHYARIDVEKLRRYSLTPPAPAGRFHAFLYGEVK